MTPPSTKTNDLSAADVDHLGREERRRCGARADELPERDVEVPELPLGPVVRAPPDCWRAATASPSSRCASRSAAASGAGRSRGSSPRRAPCRSRAARRSSSYLKRKRSSRRALSNMSGRVLDVEVADLVDGHPDREARRDDRAGARAGDVVEVVGEHEVVAARRTPLGARARSRRAPRS